MTSILLRGGTLLTMDPAVPDGPGDVLVVDGRIAAVGGAIDAPEGAEVVDATGRIVLPGLVDTHRHVWQAPIRGLAADWTLGEYFARVHGRLFPAYRPEDVLAGDLLGAREALWSGVTTVLDFNQVASTQDHVAAAIEGLDASGIRAVYAPLVGGAGEEALAGAIDGSVGLVTTALAARAAEAFSPEVAEADVRLARDHGVRAIEHVGGGVRGRRGRSIGVLEERGLMGPDLIFIHCNLSGDDELRALAAAGASASISPRVEMRMGHGWPATGRLLAAGAVPTLSVDVVTGVPGDLLADARAALEAEHLRRNTGALDADEDAPGHELTAADALRWATIEGARALALDDRIGSITVGKDADLIVLDVRTPAFSPDDDPAGCALSCGPRDVEHVLVAGRFAKRDSALVGVDPGDDLALAARTREHLLAAL